MDVPAIYILKMEKPVTRLRLAHAPWSIDSDTWQDAALIVEGERIAGTVNDQGRSTECIDLSGYVLLPGLINAHDHLEFALYPNLGRAKDATPYLNATEWAQEIHQTQHIHDRAAQARPAHHAPLVGGDSQPALRRHDSLPSQRDLSRAAVTGVFPFAYSRASDGAHSLAFEKLLAQRYLDTPAEQPFILHAAEGTDEETSEEMQRLDRMHVLTDRTVLVHALALTAADISLLNDRGAAVILCPTSNQFLFAGTVESDRISLIARACSRQ